jgi:hypothetical protein
MPVADVLRGQSWRMAQQDTSRSTRGGSVSATFKQAQLDNVTRWCVAVKVVVLLQ